MTSSPELPLLLRNQLFKLAQCDFRRGPKAAIGHRVIAQVITNHKHIPGSGRRTATATGRRGGGGQTQRSSNGHSGHGRRCGRGGRMEHSAARGDCRHEFVLLPLLWMIQRAARRAVVVVVRVGAFDATGRGERLRRCRHCG